MTIRAIFRRYGIGLAAIGLVVTAMMWADPAAAQMLCSSNDLQSCIDDVANDGGGDVILENRTYYIDDSIRPKSGVNIIGQGRDSVITWDPSIANTVNERVFEHFHHVNLEDVLFSDFRILCTVDTSDPDDRDRTKAHGIYINGIIPGTVDDPIPHSNLTFVNLEIHSCGGDGIIVGGARDVTLLNINAYDNGWADNDLFHNTYLRRILNLSVIQTNDRAGFRDSPAGHGLRLGNNENVYLEGLVVENNADHGIHINYSNDITGYDLTVRGNCATPRGTCAQTADYDGSRNIDLELNSPATPPTRVPTDSSPPAPPPPPVEENPPSGTSGETRIEAESFASSAGVQVVRSNAVGYIEDGDSAVYNVDFSDSGVATVHARVASDTSGGSIQLLVDGADAGTLDVPSTGAWTNWVDVSATVRIPEANRTQSLELVFRGGGGYLFDLDHFWFVHGESAGPIVEPDQPTANAGTDYFFEAEDYIAATAGARVVGGRDDGNVLGYIRNGYGSDYQIAVRDAGVGEMTLRVATPNSGVSVDVFIDGVRVGEIAIPNTGDFERFATVTGTIDVPPSLDGKNTEIRLAYQGGNGYVLDINWFELEF